MGGLQKRRLAKVAVCKETGRSESCPKGRCMQADQEEAQAANKFLKSEHYQKQTCDQRRRRGKTAKRRMLPRGDHVQRDRGKAKATIKTTLHRGALKRRMLPRAMLCRRLRKANAAQSDCIEDCEKAMAASRDCAREGCERAKDAARGRV